MRNWYRVILASMTFTLFSSATSFGQIKIIADTLSGSDCGAAYRMRADIFIITSEEDRERVLFYGEPGDGCLPFEDVDFETTIIVGYKYEGSNCDEAVKWSEIHKRDKGYLIQFATKFNICRDSKVRIAWFIIDKPKGEFNIEFERKARVDEVNSSNISK